MNFNIKHKSGIVPELKYGPPGRELSCFVPDEYRWEQVNYGQGEGQVIVNGCEWGFYYTDDDSISVVLHDGKISRDEAISFVEAVKLRVYGSAFGEVEIGEK